MARLFCAGNDWFKRPFMAQRHSPLAPASLLDFSHGGVSDPADRGPRLLHRKRKVGFHRRIPETTRHLLLAGMPPLSLPRSRKRRQSSFFLGTSIPQAFRSTTLL